MVTLNVQKRDKKNSNDYLRQTGVIPAVFYGEKEKSTPISVLMKDFLKVWESAGESTVITLNDGEKDHQALIHEVDLDPVTDKPIHVDFYVIEKGKKVEVDIPLEFVGVAPAIKELGGILVKVMHELKIKAEASKLPHKIEIDISPIVDFQTQIHVKDIKLPEGVELVDNPEEVVALVSEAKEEPEEPVAEASIADIEIEKKGKEEEGAEGEVSTEDKKGE